MKKSKIFQKLMLSIMLATFFQSSYAVYIYKYSLDASLAGEIWNDVHIDINTGNSIFGPAVVSVENIYPNSTLLGLPISGVTLGFGSSGTVGFDVTPNQNPTGGYSVVLGSDGAVTLFDYWFTKNDIKVGQSFKESTGVYHNNPIFVGTVPVPAAAWLFGSGLIGLIGIAKRKKA